MSVKNSYCLTQRKQGVYEFSESFTSLTVCWNISHRTNRSRVSKNSHSKLRILFVTPYYKPYLGGIERVIEKLGQEFIDRDEVTNIAVLTTKWVFPSNPRDPREYRADLPDHEKIDNLEIFRVSSFPKTAPPFYQVPLVWFPPLEIKHVIEQFDPDVIQLMSDRWFWGNFWAWAFSGARQVTFSLSFHKLDYGKQTSLPLWLLKQILRPINAFLTRRVSWVHAITQHEKKLVQETYKTPAKKFKIIPWGVEGAAGQLDSRTAGQPWQKKDPLKILAVGRVSRHKGQLWLVERFVEAEFDMPTELVLVGKTDDEEYLQRIQRSGIRDQETDKRITVTGEVTDKQLKHHYQTADLFTLFPEYEAFGLVFLEAMSYGVPVLTHDVGAIKEILKEGARITPAYNKTVTTEALERLVNDNNLRNNLATEAQSHVAKNFSWQKTANKFIKQYQANI